jgi:predicted RNA methylase
MSDTGLNRNTIDKFYTKTDIAKQCIKYFFDTIKPLEEDIILEPSAGNGSFSNQLKNEKNKIIGYDILPESDDIIKQDFLKLDIKQFENKTIHIIGNPPFGRQSSMAKLFIKKCCEFAKTISFILPKSFKKDSFQNTFDKYYHLVFEIDLSQNSFMINDIEYDVPCIFQIWKKMNNKRQEIIKLEPTYYDFVKKNENPDLAFRRVGVYAGKIHTQIDDKSEQSHYFIKLNNINTNTFLEKYKTITFNHDNTVGPKSISKQELIKKINDLF